MFVSDDIAAASYRIKLECAVFYEETKHTCMYARLRHDDGACMRKIDERSSRFVGTKGIIPKNNWQRKVSRSWGWQARLICKKRAPLRGNCSGVFSSIRRKDFASRKSSRLQGAVSGPHVRKKRQCSSTVYRPHGWCTCFCWGAAWYKQGYPVANEEEEADPAATIILIMDELGWW